MASGDLTILRADELERLLFATWLSGFTDGEGCFRLAWSRQKQGKPKIGVARFLITLRADDKPILEEIKATLGCGAVYDRKAHARSKPAAILLVSNLSDFTSTLIPLFDACPLKAKKAKQYAVWKQGVNFIAARSNRRRVGGGFGRGLRSKWNDRDISEFGTLILALKDQREFKAEELAPGPIIEPEVADFIQNLLPLTG